MLFWVLFQFNNLEEKLIFQTYLKDVESEKVFENDKIFFSVFQSYSLDNNSRVMTNKGRKATVNNLIYKKYSFHADVKN